MGSSDRLTVIATGAAIVVAIVGSTCSTNARIGDLNARIDDVHASLNARIDDVHASLNARIDEVHASLSARIDQVHASLSARIDRLEARLDGIDGRLRGVEIAFGQVDRRLATLERALLPAPAP